MLLTFQSHNKGGATLQQSLPATDSSTFCVLLMCGTLSARTNSGTYWNNVTFSRGSVLKIGQCHVINLQSIFSVHGVGESWITIYNEKRWFTFLRENIWVFTFHTEKYNFLLHFVVWWHSYISGTSITLLFCS